MRCRCRTLVKRFPRATALTGISFDVRAGEVVGLRLLYLALVAALVSWVFRLALRRGLLPKIR